MKRSWVKIVMLAVPIAVFIPVLLLVFTDSGKAQPKIQLTPHLVNQTAPVFRTISAHVHTTIFTRSRMRRDNTSKELITSTKLPAWIRLRTIVTEPYLTDSVRFVHVLDKSGAKRSQKWRISQVPGQPDIHILEVSSDELKRGSMLKVGFTRIVNYSSGYFVAEDFSIGDDWGMKKYSGCLNIADGVPSALDHNVGMAVTAMRDPPSGFHEWCFQYRPPTRAYDKLGSSVLHYFSVSTAPSWKGVAKWVHKAFVRVEAEPSKRLIPIATHIGLHDIRLGGRKKITRVEHWMRTHLKYSGDDTGPMVPDAFDDVVARHAGDCKGLTLVMVELLRQASIVAHPVVMSASLQYPFNRSSANLHVMDHVAVYIPKYNLFYEPSSGSGYRLRGHQVMDVVDGKIMMVPFTNPVQSAGSPE